MRDPNLAKSDAAPAGEDDAGLLGLAAAGLAVGVAAGLVATAFHLVLDNAGALRGQLAAWARTEPWFGWAVVAAIAAAAAWIARSLVDRYAPQASGSGVQHVEAVVRGEAAPGGAAIVPVKFFGGTLAIGAGFALGREGPTVQMGAALGHLLARWTRFSRADANALLAAGAGAGLAAAFNAPLAGAIFVFEELVRRFDLRITVATLAACSGGLAVMRAISGDRTVFTVPALDVDLFPGYLLVVALGGLMGLLGVAYTRATLAGLDLVERLPGRSAADRAAVVGAVVGALAVFAPGLVGSGEALVQDVFDGSHGIELVAIVLVVRFFLGPLCYAPGLPGGLFAPLLFVGMAAGVLFGHAAEATMAAVTIPAPAFAAVGMGALFAAVVRAPITGIALVVEMTGSSALLVPLLTACAAATAVPAMFGVAPIYDTLRERDERRRAGGGTSGAGTPRA